MSYERVNTLKIQTPDGVAFSFPVAGPVTRFFAWIIDLACILATFSLIQSALKVFALLSSDIFTGVAILMFFVLTVAYGIVLEWYWRGQTLGKRLMRLRVVDMNGLRLQFSQIAIRNLLRPIDLLPALYFVGGLACLMSRRNQRLGDYAANTIVVRAQRSADFNIESLTAGKYNSFREHPVLEIRLRQRVNAEEAALAVQALMRREAFEPEARVNLFKEFADYFKSLVTFPEEATQGLTDEQYVRNVVESIFRSKG